MKFGADKSKWIVGAVCLALLLPVAIALSNSAHRKFNPFLDREIAGQMTISSEWVEITPQEPLKPEREIHEVILEFAVPYEPDYQSWAIRFPDGSLVVPEVQLVDGQGKTYELKISSLDRTVIGFSMRDSISHREILPKNEVYPTVRIRSDKPIQGSKVVWRSFNPWDRK